ncbi:MAG: indolepyruvate ferredoxin oxidoreductase subunit alpha [Kiritimatiellae bacterium]|nr:indolepyruvate ferredoxin oxidoreductase subunit alpha [Kiritimatiellia bacterium]
MKELLTGNEAIARGAYEAGVTVATGYPGTPSTEILEAAKAYREVMYLEWSPNEKVAFEVAAAASMAGARSIVTMKHVGLNVAADPLMTFSYIGAVGGFVACVADDPGQHSSQNEQDTRHYARLAKVPIFEPATSQDAKDFMRYAIELSELFETPVILRTTTRVSHSGGLVETSERTESPNPVEFKKNPQRFTPLPAWGRLLRRKVEERLGRLSEAATKSPANRIEWGDRSLGIIAPGMAYSYVREAFPEASVLKLGFSYPFPDALIREFAGGVKRLLVVEELENILEEHIRAMGIACDGKNLVPVCGELSPGVLKQVRARLEGREPREVKAVEESVDLPGRPPLLCAGCPHRGIFYALGKFDVIVTGDIGCYSLGVFPPLSRTDTILCMGGGVSMAHGMEKAGEKKPVVGIVGDSTFFHSGITGLLDIVYNKGTSTIIVVDNRTTAMTGHQDHPGTGRTLMGEETVAVDIEAIGRACGVRRVTTVNPYDLDGVIEVLREELAAKEPSLIISRGPCVLAEKVEMGGVYAVDASACKKCKACLKLGCPAIEYDLKGEGIPLINASRCVGCGMCARVCRFGAIKR